MMRKEDYFIHTVNWVVQFFFSKVKCFLEKIEHFFPLCKQMATHCAPHTANENL